MTQNNSTTQNNSIEVKNELWKPLKTEIVRVWKPRLQTLKKFGVAYALFMGTAVAFAICLAHAVLPLVIAGIVATEAIVDPKGPEKISRAWSKSVSLYKNSFVFVKNEILNGLREIFGPAKPKKPALSLAAPPALETSAFQNGSSKQAFNQETQPAANLAPAAAPVSAAPDLSGPKN